MIEDIRFKIIDLSGNYVLQVLAAGMWTMVPVVDLTDEERKALQPPQPEEERE